MVITHQDKVPAAACNGNQSHWLSGLAGLIDQDVRETFFVED
jgi:hypothetical protein